MNQARASDKRPASVEAERRRKGRLVLVTGMSGAGRSSALKTFEDMGFDAVDNMPLGLLWSLTSADSGLARDLAVGVDIRTRDFGTGPVLAEMDRVMAEGRIDVSLVFFDSSDEILQRRFTETRRPHPLATDRPVLDGIARERELLKSLRDRADLVIDTTDLIPSELRRMLTGHFNDVEPSTPTAFVTSFSYRNGIPREADLVFDVRFLANPHYEPSMRDRTGLEPEVGAFIAEDPQFEPFFEALTRLMKVLVPGYIKEGKSYLTIAVGCTGGRHRSVYVAERLGAWLREESLSVDISHREIRMSSEGPRSEALP
ncbi:MAG TPA: RNase adapter RapZ [Alphaproteobacteria bacterium]|nr:RNase adapter RapZ [Alphaproteobacteria bacterium]